jgi:hypothetical protein
MRARVVLSESTEQAKPEIMADDAPPDSERMPAVSMVAR